MCFLFLSEVQNTKYIDYYTVSTYCVMYVLVHFLIEEFEVGMVTPLDLCP